jgi:hypothetical protein
MEEIRMKTQQQCRSCGRVTYDGQIHVCDGMKFDTDPGYLRGKVPDGKIRVAIPVSTLMKMYAILETIPDIAMGTEALKKEILDIVNGN